jgi:hypothetical protein
LARLAAHAVALAAELRPGVTVEDTRDVLWLCSSPEIYELLVVRRGWSAEALGEFAAKTMAATLL